MIEVYAQIFRLSAPTCRSIRVQIVLENTQGVIGTTNIAQYSVITRCQKLPNIVSVAPLCLTLANSLRFSDLLEIVCDRVIEGLSVQRRLARVGCLFI